MAVKKRKARSAQLDAAPVSRLQTARCGKHRVVEGEEIEEWRAAAWRRMWVCWCGKKEK